MDDVHKKQKTRRSFDLKIQLLEKWTKMKGLLLANDSLYLATYEDGTYGIQQMSDSYIRSLSWDCATPAKAIDSALIVFRWESGIESLNWSCIELELAIGGIDA